MSPNSCTGGRRSAGVGAQRVVVCPAQMTARVPATGSIAAMPGNGVALV
jgi:hypothetical protein